MKIDIKALKKDIEDLGFTVQVFSDHHWRINDRLDIWPTTKSYYFKENGDKGKYVAIWELLAKCFPEKLDSLPETKTLRDEIAIEAMKNMMSTTPNDKPVPENYMENIAKYSYQIANEMLKARSK